MKYSVKPATFLTSLWTFILFNMLLRDLHEFPTDGYIEEMMALKLSDQTMLLYAFVVEIPILMVLLPNVLNYAANKWANTVAVIVSSLGILSTMPTADFDDIFFGAINLIAMVVVTRVAWQLPDERLTNSPATLKSE